MSRDAVALARAVIARGDTETETHQLAAALIGLQGRAESAEAKVGALRAYHRSDGGPDDCGDAAGECCLCGILDCPHGEPLHWHHDGCPACSEEDG